MNTSSNSTKKMSVISKKSSSGGISNNVFLLICGVVLLVLGISVYVDKYAGYYDIESLKKQTLSAFVEEDKSKSKAAVGGDLGASREKSANDPVQTNASNNNNNNDFSLETGEFDGGDDLKTIAYYRCGKHVNEDVPDHKQIDLVLLHGSAFTKEDWKSSGILGQFCQFNKEGLSITALDLPVSADFEHFLTVFKEMRAKKLISSSKPIALVTPSASGKVIIDYIQKHETKYHGEDLALHDYVDHWIPVATYGLGPVTEQQVSQVLSSHNMVTVMAVYGDQDPKGKNVSEKLYDLVHGSEMVELKGRHPCYLDSPTEFVNKVLEFLGYKAKST